MKILFTILLLCISFFGMASSQSLSKQNNTFTLNTPGSTGLLDPSRFSIHHMVSLGMSSASSSSIKSAGMYTTMVAYQFTQPVTLNLNFGMPLFSTGSPSQNLNAANISSTEYFKNMPLDATLSWKPAQNMLMQVSVSRNPLLLGFPAQTPIVRNQRNPAGW